ncbi:MAG: hypothetical protein R3C68_11980 [Myxococcota bacterium]
MRLPIFIGPAIERLTILSEGNLLQGMPGSVVLPSMLLSWVGLQKATPTTPHNLAT